MLHRNNQINLLSTKWTLSIHHPDNTERHTTCFSTKSCKFLETTPDLSITFKPTSKYGIHCLLEGLTPPFPAPLYLWLYQQSPGLFTTKAMPEPQQILQVYSMSFFLCTSCLLLHRSKLWGTTKPQHLTWHPAQHSTCWQELTVQ